MQIQKIALATTLLALLSQGLSPFAWAVNQKRSVVAENYPEDILPDSVGLYVTPRGQKILTNGLPLLRQNGIQISRGSIPQWNYIAAAPIDIQNLPITMSDHKTTLEDIQKSILKNVPSFQPFNNPKIKLQLKGISYQAQITRLNLVPDLEETQFIHTPNTIVVEAQIEASKLKLGVNSIVLNDSANSLFDNGDIGLNAMTITSAADSLPLTFNIPLSITLDEQSHIQIKALRVENNLANFDTVWDYSKLVLPPFQITWIDPNDKNALKDGKKMSVNWGNFDPEIRAQLPKIEKAATAYLSQYVKENGVDIINKAFSSVVDVNTMFQEVNTMAPPGSPSGTTPVPYMWGLAPHTLSLDNQFLFTQINSFIEDPLSSQHIALPSAARAKGPPNMNAVDPSTYDLALQLDEGFVNRLLQLSFLRGYFNSIPEKGLAPLKLVAAPTITSDGTTSPDHLKMHIVLNYTNDPTGELKKLVESWIINNPLQITFDMDVVIKVDSKSGSVTLEEGQIDVEHASVDPSGIKVKLLTSKIMDAVHASLNHFNDGLKNTPATLTSALTIPSSIAGIPIILKSVQADPSGNIMAYVQYGQFDQSGASQ